MITKSLAKNLEENGFVYVEGASSDKSHAYAIYGGYLVTVYENSGKKILFINYRCPDCDENSISNLKVSEKLSAELSEYSIVDYSISEDGLRVYSNGSVATFLKLLDRCIEILIENETRGVEYCSVCGNKFGSRKPKKVTNGKENHIMCEHCALEFVEQAKKNAEKKNAENASGKILYGILGSVGFSLIGLLVYFLLYYVLSPELSKLKISISEVRYIFCIAGFAVSVLSYYGYRIFCKKVSLAAYITVPVNALIFSAIGQYIGVVLEFVTKNGFHLSALKSKAFWLIHLRNTVPADIAEYFPSYSAIFWKLLIISLLFAAVGSAMFLLSMHDKSIIKSDPIETETLTIKP